MQDYTVSTLIETGKTDPTFGTEYHVKFAESDRTFKLWFKKAPVAGDKIKGEIDDWKFKKAPREFVDTKSSAGKPAPRSYGAQQADKSDGMRQGMCINNASEYIKDISDKPLAPSDWADAVYTYANALYSKGDLKAESNTEAPITEQSIEEAPQNVKEIFGR